MTAFGANAPPNFLWNTQADLPAIGSSLTLTSQGSVTNYMAVY